VGSEMCIRDRPEQRLLEEFPPTPYPSHFTI
jgi:hypothetical protein